MKSFLYALLLLGATSAHAGSNDLLERALRCELKDEELKPLMRNLAAQNPGFLKPVRQHGAPSYDVYRIATAASAHGFSATEIAVFPTIIYLIAGGTTYAEAAKGLKLTPHELEDISFGTRTVRPTVDIVANGTGIEGAKVLIGCRYANDAAVRWVDPGSSFGL